MMFKLAKYLKPYWWQIIVLLASVAVQVWASLQLPALMADIVNDGIVAGNSRNMTGRKKYLPKNVWIVSMRFKFSRAASRVFQNDKNRHNYWKIK